LKQHKECESDIEFRYHAQIHIPINLLQSGIPNKCPCKGYSGRAYAVLYMVSGSTFWYDSLKNL